MAKLSAVVLAMIALSATNTMALPRNYAARGVMISAGPDATPTPSTDIVTATAAHVVPTGVNGTQQHPHPHGGSRNGTHWHGRPHNGTHPHGGRPHNGTQLHTTQQQQHPTPTQQQQQPTPTQQQQPTPSNGNGGGMMQIEGNTYTPGTKLSAQNSTEADNATHASDNSSLDIQGSGSGSGGTMQLGSNILPGGSTVHESDDSSADTANHSQSSSSLQVNQ
jgi:hypothetical protein